ncbi:MAG: hypothetical protein KKE62_10805 [Proteobacteria bacterium]|nr:hypothetical protein [Pseudomonadota bacterium]MBU1386706.1 hypothetical protein [Pseudomonadota bacterium]MBU1543317.1 hypothetical protein [Pseudomonadota bacterium]MBU2483148.1 hypothetical protein [Pseudomonadota bacterium]
MNKSKRIGYSNRIHDPAFANYVENSAKYAWIFSSILAGAATLGFYIYGETSHEMENPQALYIGLVIGTMFMTIAFLTNRSKQKGWTWDGTVCDRQIEKKQRKVYNTGNDYYMQDYQLFKVVIQSDHRKKYELTAENDDTVYNYYQVGDKVRHHGKLRTYEKYDKTGDTIIFCNACASLNEMDDDVCHRCGCPLLK